MNVSLIDRAKSEITLDNDKLNLKLIPDLGGKIIGLTFKKPGTQFLKLSDISLENIPEPEFGDLIWKVENQNFNIVASESLGFSAKLFSDKHKTGKAGIIKKETSESLMFSFDIDETPYLGIWICYGGWPADSSEKEYTLALEPCSGLPVDLSTAIDRNESSTIEPGVTKKWSVNIKLYNGKEKLN